MNRVIYLREEQPRLWQASPDGVQWTILVQGSTEAALVQARLTFSRQLVAITGSRSASALVA